MIGRIMLIVSPVMQRIVAVKNNTVRHRCVGRMGQGSMLPMIEQKFVLLLFQCNNMPTLLMPISSNQVGIH